VVGLITARLGGLNVSWGEEEWVFVGHIDKMHAFVIPS